MKKFNLSEVELHFEFHSVNDDYMNLSIINQEKTILVEPNVKKIIKLEIEFPTEIILDISGKNMLTGTLIDENEKIIDDTYIKLTAVVIDKILIPEPFIETWPETARSRTPYFGFNEQVRLKFLEKTAFHWIIKTTV